MRVSLKKIREFYQSEIGLYACGRLGGVLDSFWKDFSVPDKTIICSAASYPYIHTVKEKAGRLALQSHSAQETWPGEGKGHYTLVNRDLWPYRAEEIDYVVMVHDLEFAEDPDVYLKECWRVLKGEGRLLIVIPNRSGRWARQDNTPFGRGYPYTIDQIKSLLARSHFAVDTVERALYFPPYAPRTSAGRVCRNIVDAIGVYCMFSCGVYIIEAGKHIYSPTKGLGELTAEKAKSMLFPRPVATSRSAQRVISPHV